MIRLIAILAILFTAAPGFTQSLATTNNSIIDSERLIDFSASDWSFYHDDTEKSFYIDFETVDVNLNDLKVINSDGTVVFEDKLQGLPVNTIYELDMEGYPAGMYKVEIRTYTSLITKEVTLP